MEDIFEEVGKADTPAKRVERPRSPKKKPAAPLPSQETPASTPLPVPKRKRLFPVFIILIAVIVVGGAAMLYFMTDIFTGSNEASNSSDASSTAANSAGTVTTANGGAPANLSAIISQEADTDADGLSDQEEETLGTDIERSDTDNDGLYDREEVKVYKTDPLKPDTDSDGNLDGVEVANGYNPNGSGLLLDLESNIKKIEQQ